MYRKYKIILLFSLFSILSMCAGKGIFNNDYKVEESTAIANNDVLLEFNDYITTILHTTSYQIPSSVNCFTERTPVQYIRVRKTADNSNCSLKSKGVNSFSIQRIPHYNEIYAGPSYTHAREYFICTLNRLRI